MTTDDVKVIFMNLPGITLLNYHQAPGIGYHYFTFNAEKDSLSELCKALQEKPYLNCNITVSYDNGLVYRLSKSNSHMDSFVETLKSLCWVKE
jgi:hypothetical protein